MILLPTPVLKRYSYADYLTWSDDQRWELIDGIPYNMTPAPSTLHQRVSARLLVAFATYLQGKPCEVFAAPFDVRLAESADDAQTFNVVQPDLVIICDSRKIDERGCQGAPDLVVEILSPGQAARRDRLEKYQLYQRYGVREYWLVDPYHETVEIYALKEGKFERCTVYSRSEVAISHIFPELAVELKDVFPPLRS
ncbi:Uma2 family endonuclease [Desulfurispora thermophila]|uniref:Uma2 family endonuclease n=1 Tax=Desulfurispora thermophila TaxID=265470 RepID=UPI0012EAF93D